MKITEKILSKIKKKTSDLGTLKKMQNFRKEVNFFRSQLGMTKQEIREKEKIEKKLRAL